MFACIIIIQYDIASVEALAEARRREVEIGARIQQTLLFGQLPTDLNGVEVAALTIPSQQIDGDFYDFFQHTRQCLDVIVGDVMGKGVPAALFGAAIKSHFLRALSQLLSFQLDRIKIDRSFVDRMGKDKDSTIIVRAILGLANGFGLATTAEGIENSQQLAAMKADGCQEGQGYLFGKAVPAREVASVLERLNSEIRVVA